MSAALELHRVLKDYGQGPTLVRTLTDVDLSVGLGELVAVMGPSGSRKTTLLTIAAHWRIPSASEPCHPWRASPSPRPTRQRRSYNSCRYASA